MRSRYSAFILKNYKYIINTTHKENSDFTDDLLNWQKDILNFCESCEFRGLKILEFIDGENEAFVTFHATIFCESQDNSFTEKSRFMKVNNKWLYHSGEFINS